MILNAEKEHDLATLKLSEQQQKAVQEILNSTKNTNIFLDESDGPSVFYKAQKDTENMSRKGKTQENKKLARHQETVYAFAEIQNPKQKSKIWFCGSKPYFGSWPNREDAW